MGFSPHGLKEKMTSHLTPYHAKYFAYELTRRYSSDSLQKLAASLSDAQVDLNPHQVEAALFAFRSPLSKGAILADEVGLGKTIEAGIVISQKWADDVKSSIELELKELDREIKARKTEAKKILKLEEKVKAQRQIKEMEKRRNELRQNLYQAQDEVDSRKEKLIEEIEARMKQKIETNQLFLVKWKLT